MKFKIKGIPKENLQELMEELKYFGVLEFTIEGCNDGLILSVDDEEWKNSWESVGFKIPDDSIKHTEVFREELEGIAEGNWGIIQVEAL